ncbi:hypothetical protein DYB34_003792 [Aphanomyces astaci]|uniref:Vacuolar protein 8 n=1 Tax=Aphanomyces astaci TaxID=112090 RepID=A0A397AHK5_APHAT|nr:hypothetical protein DYB36_002931 [Aphanomyces astaci]RHY66638.1 hypothetical protein DYB34_003792 [Aphanomyces astaci]
MSFAAHDGIPVVLEAAWSPSFHVKVLCTTALCRLSCYPEFTKTLFASKAVIELSNMLSLPHPPLQKLCIQTLVNMICHGCEFHEKLFCGGGNVGHNKLGLVLAISQLAEEPANGRFAAQVIFNLSLSPTSAAGAIRGGIGEVLFHLIKAPHTTLTLAKLRLTPNSSSHDAEEDDSNPQLVIARLIAIASGHFSKYLDLQLLMGSWSLKIVQHFLYLYESSPRLGFVLGHCARVLANLSANDEYMSSVFNGNEDLVEKIVRLHAWASAAATTTTTLNADECQQNVLRTIANVTRCPLCCPLLVQSGVFYVLNEVLLMEANTSHVATLKDDALVALVNLVCHDAIAPAAGLDAHLADCLSTSFRRDSSDDQNNNPHLGHVKYMLSLTICYLALNPHLRRVVTSRPALLIDALLFGFHYNHSPGADNADKAPCLSGGMLKLQQQLREQPLDAFDDVRGDPTDVSGEFQCVDHIQSLVDVVVTCMIHPKHSAKIPVDHGFVTGAVEYYCAGMLCCFSSWTLPLSKRPGILFTLSRTIWTLTQQTHESANDWGAILFAPRVQDVVFRLSRFAAHPCPPTSPTTGDNNSRALNLRPATQAYCTGSIEISVDNAHLVVALVEACNGSEDPPTLLACASTFAIVSFTPEGRQLLLTTQGLAHALNKLGRSSMCQQYAAVAACNVAITGCMWNEEELKDFVVVALLRSNSFDAIQVHAKTLYNLLSHPASRAQVISDGVLYAFLKLAQLQTNGLRGGPEETLSLCLHALFNLSDTVVYHDTILKLGVTAFLLGGVSGRRKRVLHFLTPESRRHAVGLLCNLSAREANHKELIHSAQVTDILRCLCDGDTETRASAAMTLRNLTLRVANAEVVRVCTRNALNLLLVFLTSSNDSVRRLAAQAIGNCSLVTELLHLFVELQVGDALLQVLETHDPTTNLMVRRWQEALPPLLYDPDVCNLAATTLHILSRKAVAAPLLARQNIVALCQLLSTAPHTSATVLGECVSCLVHLSTHIATHTVLFETGVVDTLGHLLHHVGEIDPPLSPAVTAILFTHAAMAVRNLSLSAADRQTSSQQDQRSIDRSVEQATAMETSAACDQLMRGVPWLVKMVRTVATSQPSYPKLCVEVCAAMANLCKIKRLRAACVSAGIVHMLLDIHRTFKSNDAFAFVEQSSTVTLHQLAAEDTATLEPGLIEALLKEGKVSRLETVDTKDDLALDELAAKTSAESSSTGNHATHQLRFTPVKKFDHHMKMTRKQSRNGYVGTSSSALPHIKSELQVEK